MIEFDLRGFNLEKLGTRSDPNRQIVGTEEAEIAGMGPVLQIEVQTIEGAAAGEVDAFGQAIFKFYPVQARLQTETRLFAIVHKVVEQVAKFVAGNDVGTENAVLQPDI